jgi:hypothetical protein
MHTDYQLAPLSCVPAPLSSSPSHPSCVPAPLSLPPSHPFCALPPSYHPLLTLSRALWQGVNTRHILKTRGLTRTFTISGLLVRGRGVCDGRGVGEGKKGGGVMEGVGEGREGGGGGGGCNEGVCVLWAGGSVPVNRARRLGRWRTQAEGEVVHALMYVCPQVNCASLTTTRRETPQKPGG